MTIPPKITTEDQVYVYAWANNERRAELKGRECIVLVRGGKRTVLVQFLDTGEKVTTSERALRRVEWRTVTWNGVTARYTPRELTVMSRHRDRASRAELLFVHALKSALEAKIIG